MKRLLIITYYWPPSAGSGVQRWLKFSKYLPENGWQPVVYTPENPDFHVKDASLAADIPPEAEVVKRPIHEPYALYRTLTGKKKDAGNFGMTKAQGKSGIFQRLSFWARGNLFIPDPRVLWVRPSVRFLKKYLKEHPVDAIATTGPPHSMHLIGLGLKKAFPDLPWLADMRDPWAKLDYLPAFQTSRVSMKKHLRLEKSVIDHSDKVILVTPSMNEEFQPIPADKHLLIYNGYDPDDFKGIEPPAVKRDFFCMYYTGLMNTIRNPEILWAVLEDLLTEFDDFCRHFRLVFIGHVEEAVRRSIQQFPRLDERVTIHPWMSHDELIEENAKADPMLLLINQSFNAKMQMTGKLFEYMALGKPVLGLCPLDGDAARAIRDTRIGKAVDFEDSAGMRNSILKYFGDWQNHQAIQPDWEAIKKFSRRFQAGQVADCLNELITLKTPG